jgi:hypothetical protein
MPRTVVVEEHSEQDEPYEWGRATLNAQGHVIVTGFSDPLREHYIKDGIKDRIGFDGRERGTIVPITDGNAFLDLLLLEYSGVRVRARQL